MINLLKKKYHTLTESGKKIADYIIDNPETFLSMTVNEVGALSGTSPASVVRFAKSLGFKNFEELRINTAKNLNVIQNASTLNVISSKEDDTKTLIHKLSGNVDMSITSTLNNIDVSDFDKAMDRIIDANCIYLYGMGASGIAASDLYHKLNRANKRAVYNSDSHMALEVSCYIEPTDVVIAFSYSGLTKEINYAIEQARKNGAFIIVITKEPKSKLTKNANIVFLVPYIEGVVRIGAISSKYSSMIIADLLFLSFVNRKYDDIEQGFFTTSMITRKLKEKSK